jgi:D-amino-acid dehydrogenase
VRAAIVGAGVLGASTTFHVALAGAEVVVLDQADAGRATAVNAGIVSPWTSGRVDPNWRRIAGAGEAGAVTRPLPPEARSQA